MYEHLNLRAWPFQVVPDSEFATIWAGRRRTKKQLERLIWKMQFAPKSGLHLLWANFGMGKTHTLLHLQHLCQQTQGRLIPVRSCGVWDVATTLQRIEKGTERKKCRRYTGVTNTAKTD